MKMGICEDSPADCAANETSATPVELTDGYVLFCKKELLVIPAPIESYKMIFACLKFIRFWLTE
jgi:hypothetical protein